MADARELVAVPGYAGLHRRLERQRGHASEFSCDECGDPAQEWAYDHSDPDEITDDPDGRPYSLDFERYRPLCVSCHRRSDMQDSCRKGHEFTPENTYVYRGTRLCRTCRAENMRQYRRDT